nr:unnamed protein product [Salmo salar]|eukprot:XP_014016011.1 PREDICTED: collagen alpha-1(II) chain-like isoform X2 [Salmo salar]
MSFSVSLRTPGIEGDKGEMGEPGVEGEKGEMGRTGPPGAQGLKGTQGPLGEPGSDGLKGEQGDIGPHGGWVTPRLTRLPGFFGETGLKGFAGKSGHVGVRGLPGLPGPPGPPGTSLNLTLAQLKDLMYLLIQTLLDSLHQDLLIQTLLDSLHQDLLIQTLLDSLHQDLGLFIDLPDGTKEHPATTCLELWLSQPNFTNGMYYIDPNQGSPADAILVYCDFTAAPKTCLSPLHPQVPMTAWLKDSGTNSSFHWLSSMEKGFQFEYPGPDVVQMRFLRLNSRLTSQNIIYSCQPGNKQRPGEREVKFLADTQRQSYLGTLRDCVSSEELDSGERRDSGFQFESEDLNLLPLRDLAVFGSSDLTQEFGFTVGPVCFS